MLPPTPLSIFRHVPTGKPKPPEGGIFLLVLSVARIGIDRAWIQDDAPPVDETELGDLLAESRAVRDEEARRSAPLAAGELLDPNRSGEEALDRLPGIGPATAKAVVREREENGAFIQPEDLLRVAGIGPATLAKIRPSLDFSQGVPLELRKRGGEGNGLPSAGVENGAARPPSPQVAGTPPTARVDLNRGSPEELQALPGIGPALAKRIVESRVRDGPFRNPDDLLRVRGIGPAILSRIRTLVIPIG